MNSVVLIGRLTKDTESRMTQSEKQTTTFTIAIDRPYAKEKTADFLRVVTFGKTAENCAKYISKGSLVGVQGRIQTGSYETTSGEKRYTTEIIADRVEFLESKKDKQSKDEIPEGFQALEDDDVCPF